MASSKMLYRVLMIGAPGSGKGTISSRVVQKYGFQHIASGDMMRDNTTPAGKIAEKYVKSGELVPDDVVVDCVLNKLKEEPHSRVLLDGFPRTQGQAVKLAKVFPLDAILHLIVPYEIILDRVKNRWVHLPSGRTYNIGFNDPKVPFKDDVTGEDLQKRPDDQPEVVQERLKHYDAMTKPVLEFYKKQDIVMDIFGKTSAEIWPHVDSFLSKALDNKQKTQAA